MLVFFALIPSLFTSQILKYYFNWYMCENNLIIDEMGTTLNLIIDNPYSVVCVSPLLNDVGNADGIMFKNCYELNAVYCNLRGSTIFNTFYTNHDISIEVWFSFSSAASSGSTFPFVEVSTDTEFPSTLLSVSASTRNPNLNLVSTFSNGQANFDFRIGAYFNPSGICNFQNANTSSLTNKTSGFNAIYSSIGSTINTLYKLAMTIDYQGNTFIYIKSGVSSIEYANTFQKSSRFTQNALLKYVVNPLAMIRVGCSVGDYTLPKAPVTIHKLSLYDKALSIGDVELIF